MKVSILGSGSGGNSIFVESNGVKLSSFFPSI